MDVLSLGADGEEEGVLERDEGDVVAEVGEGLEGGRRRGREGGEPREGQGRLGRSEDDGCPVGFEEGFAGGGEGAELRTQGSESRVRESLRRQLGSIFERLREANVRIGSAEKRFEREGNAYRTIKAVNAALTVGEGWIDLRPKSVVETD